MMTRMQYLLSKLAEEASEVAQAAIKAQIFGVHERYVAEPTNIERVSIEFNDMLSIIDMINEEIGGLCITVNPQQIENKKTKVEHYMEFSRSLGLLEQMTDKVE